MIFACSVFPGKPARSKYYSPRIPQIDVTPIRMYPFPLAARSIKVTQQAHVGLWYVISPIHARYGTPGPESTDGFSGTKRFTETPD